jgi:hypothetical protein
MPRLSAKTCRTGLQTRPEPVNPSASALPSPLDPLSEAIHE